MECAKAPTAGNRLVEHRSTRHLGDILPKVPDSEFLRYRHVALVGLFFADNHAEQGGFAGAVRADETDFLAGVELKGCVDKQNLAAVLLADSCKRDHGVRFTATSAPTRKLRSLSRAAHFRSVGTLLVTRPSNTVLPSATIFTGFEKSNTSGDSSNVNAPTIRVVAVIVLPSRARSTRPEGRPCANIGMLRGASVGLKTPCSSNGSFFRETTMTILVPGS